MSYVQARTVLFSGHPGETRVLSGSVWLTVTPLSECGRRGGGGPRIPHDQNVVPCGAVVVVLVRVYSQTGTAKSRPSLPMTTASKALVTLITVLFTV